VALQLAEWMMRLTTQLFASNLCILRQNNSAWRRVFGDDDLEKGIMTWTCLTWRAALTGFTWHLATSPFLMGVDDVLLYAGLRDMLVWRSQTPALRTTPPTDIAESPDRSSHGVSWCVLDWTFGHSTPRSAHEKMIRNINPQPLSPTGRV
jgi:hypothetical protein